MQLPIFTNLQELKYTRLSAFLYVLGYDSVRLDNSTINYALSKWNKHLQMAVVAQLIDDYCFHNN